MNIKMPNQHEKDIAVDNILSRGLIKPKSLWVYLYEIYSSLGFRFIFWDTIQAFLLIAVSVIGVILLVPQMVSSYKYVGLFTVSPVLFSLSVIFTETIESGDVLHELKMTCKYTIRQITAFRTLCFSLAGVVFCVVTALLLNSTLEEQNIVKLISLALSALFIYACLTVFIMRCSGSKLIYAMSAIIWIAANIIPILFLGEYWERIISQIPVAITLCVSIIFCLLYLQEINKYMRTSRNEVVYYVNG